MCMLHSPQFREGVDLLGDANVAATSDGWGWGRGSGSDLSHIYEPTTYATMQIKGHKLSFKFKMAFK